MEAGFDNFTEGGRLFGRAIVKSAGNLRESALHARLYTLTGGLETLEWESQDVDRDYDTIELWFYAADEHKFTLVAPGNGTDHSHSVGTGPGHVAGSFAGGETYQMTLTRFHTDNGASRLLVNIERTPTQSIRPGVWALEISSVTVYSHSQPEAWIENQSCTTITFRSHVNREMTLTILGTARTIVTVGAVKSSAPASMARESSQGPTRDLREKPDLAATGVNVTAADSGDRVKLGTITGTSFAAPFVTGAVALLQSWRKRKSMDLLNAAQVVAALRQSAQEFHGGWNPSFGCGVLSAVKLLEVMAR